MNTFFPPDPIKDSSNKWRNVVGLLAIFVGLGTILGWQFIRFSFERPELVNDFIVRVVPNEESSVQAGGDLLIAPPQMPQPELPELAGEMISPEQFSAGSILVKDQKTNMVLFSKNEYNARAIASVTKLMSALVILENEVDWTTSTQVIGADSLGTHMYAGDTYTLQELWDAALIGSSNKAIKTLANALGWPEEAFVERMNQKARELGMSNTSFVDPTGLGDRNLSTASDVAILLEEAMKQEAIRETVMKKELTLYSPERGKSHHMWNTDWLLLGWTPHELAKIIGGKTGYTVAAGYNFVMQVADEEGHVLNVVVLGADSHEARFTEARDVAQWAFANYRWPDEKTED